MLRTALLATVAGTCKFGQIGPLLAVTMPSRRSLPVALIGSFLVAGAASPAFAQLHFCAGKPCPDTGEASTADEDSHPQRAVLIDAVVLTPALAGC